MKIPSKSHQNPIKIASKSQDPIISHENAMDFPDVQHQRAVVVCMDSGCLRNSSSVSRAAAAFTGDEGALAAKCCGKIWVPSMGVPPEW